MRADLSPPGDPSVFPFKMRRKSGILAAKLGLSLQLDLTSPAVNLSFVFFAPASRPACLPLSRASRHLTAPLQDLILFRISTRLSITWPRIKAGASIPRCCVCRSDPADILRSPPSPPLSSPLSLLSLSLISSSFPSFPSQEPVAPSSTGSVRLKAEK